MMQRKHCAGLCLLAVLQCDAAIYQWKDSAGIMQFSDRPPTEQVDVIERTDIKPGATPVPPSLPKHAPVTARKRAGRPRKAKSAGVSEQEGRRLQCAKLERRITATENKLRAGYSARLGIQLTERLRADRDTLYQDCR